MAIPTLEGCREKWARGTTLLNRVIELVGEYVGEEPPPHRTNGAFEAASGTYVITGEIVRPMPDPTMWAVLLGDAVHNLRSALDHLIWQLVLVNTGKDGSTDNQFPICDTGEGYWNPGKNGSPSQRTRRLKGISREHMAIIDTFQPYRNYEARNQNRLDPLATLRDLSNRDKHRLLHVLIMAVDVQQGHKFRLVPNEDAGEQVDTKLAPFPDRGVGDVMTVKFACPGPNPNVVSKGDLSISAGVEATRMRLTDLPGLSEAVGQIIERFAPDFP